GACAKACRDQARRNRAGKAGAAGRAADSEYVGHRDGRCTADRLQQLVRQPLLGVEITAYAGSASRFAHIALNAGRAWHAASHAFTRGAASNNSGAAWA